MGIYGCCYKKYRVILLEKCKLTKGTVIVGLILNYNYCKSPPVLFLSPKIKYSKYKHFSVTQSEFIVALKHNMDVLCTPYMLFNCKNVIFKKIIAHKHLLYQYNEIIDKHQLERFRRIFLAWKSLNTKKIKAIEPVITKPIKAKKVKAIEAKTIEPVVTAEAVTEVTKVTKVIKAKKIKAIEPVVTASQLGQKLPLVNSAVTTELIKTTDSVVTASQLGQNLPKVTSAVTEPTKVIESDKVKVTKSKKIKKIA